MQQSQSRRKRCNFEKRASPCKAQGATKRASGAQTPQAGADFKKLIEHVLDIHVYALLHAGESVSHKPIALCTCLDIIGKQRSSVICAYQGLAILRG